MRLRYLTFKQRRNIKIINLNIDLIIKIITVLSTFVLIFKGSIKILTVNEFDKLFLPKAQKKSYKIISTIYFWLFLDILFILVGYCIYDMPFKATIRNYTIIILILFSVITFVLMLIIKKIYKQKGEKTQKRTFTEKLYSSNILVNCSLYGTLLYYLIIEIINTPKVEDILFFVFLLFFIPYVYREFLKDFNILSSKLDVNIDYKIIQSDNIEYYIYYAIDDKYLVLGDSNRIQKTNYIYLYNKETSKIIKIKKEINTGIKNVR